MDEQVAPFRDHEIAERPCPFEKSMLTNAARCTRADRFCIAEREAVACHAEAPWRRCRELLTHLRTRARFALRLVAQDAALPHLKALRVQVGGLRGLRAALFPERDPDAMIEDIDALIEAAIARHGSLDSLPDAQIVQGIAAYRGRRPARARRR